MLLRDAVREVALPFVRDDEKLPVAALALSGGAEHLGVELDGVDAAVVRLDGTGTAEAALPAQLGFQSPTIDERCQCLDGAERNSNGLSIPEEKKHSS